MFSKIGISASLALALLAAPVQLSAISCVLSNAPSEKACDLGCCANKTCCETSQKNTAPPLLPLAKADSHQQINLVSPASIAIATLRQDSRELSVFSSEEWTAHSPTPLALICIRLI